jgi:hypothetical protein
MLTILTIDQQKRRAELDQTVDQGSQAFAAVALALAEIKRDELWRSTHRSFGDYCQDKLGHTMSKAYKSARVGEILSELQGPVLPSSGRQVEPLKTIDSPSDRQQAWDAVVALTEQGGRPLNRETVSAATAAVLQRKMAVEVGIEIPVVSGEHQGKTVLVSERKGVIVRGTLAGTQTEVTLLTSELTALPQKLKSAAPQIAAHPLASELELTKTQLSMALSRTRLLEQLLQEALPLLAGDVATRIQSVF